MEIRKIVALSACLVLLTGAVACVALVRALAAIDFDDRSLAGLANAAKIGRWLFALLVVFVVVSEARLRRRFDGGAQGGWSDHAWSQLYVVIAGLAILGLAAGAATGLGLTASALVDKVDLHTVEIAKLGKK
jgi:hypothetical protein